MADKKWTEEQYSAIHARGGTLLVSAAAGSGKTAVLVERVVSQLLDKEHPVDADRLLVVTFSNAAAKEMRQRIDARLGAELAKDPYDPHLRRQRFLMERAHISTVHSFCLDLVKRHTEQLQIPIDFTLGDESQLILLREEAAAEAIEQFYQKDDDGSFSELVELLSGGRDDKRLISTMFQLHAFIRSHPFYADWLNEKLKMYRSNVSVRNTVWGKTILEYAKEAVAHCQHLNALCIDKMRGDEEMESAYLPAFLDDQFDLDMLMDAIENGDWDDCVFRTKNFRYTRLGSLRHYPDTVKKDFVQDRRDHMKEIIKQLASKYFNSSEKEFREDIADLRPKVEKLFQLTLCYDDALQKIKKEKKLIDFSDLEHFALQLLMTKSTGGYVRTDLAKEISQEFDEILVDEYQDTNAAQDMIFSAVSIEKKNLFMVGDVKQSIYRFRQAMPEIFIGKMDTFRAFNGKKYPAKLQLSRNFRSRSHVTDFINYVFEMLMSRSLGEIEYNEEHRLFPGANYPPKADMESEIVLIETDKSAQESAEQEAWYVADRIAQMLTDGTTVSENGQQRPLQMSDICILMRSTKKRAALYRDALRKRGINSWSESRGGFLQAKEISVMMAFLQVLDNPYRDIPLLTVLLSDLFGMTPEQVSRIRLQDRKGALYSGLLQMAQTGDALSQNAVETIESLRRSAVRLSVADLLSEIYDRTDYPAIVSSYPMGEVRQANLRQLVRYAEVFSQKGNGGLYGFVRFLDRLSEKRTDLEGAAAGTVDNAVCVTSIHRSKGLEYPVVFLCDTGKSFNKQDIRERIALHPQMGFACMRRDKRLYKEFTTIPLEALRLENERADLSEEMRILYVAMTRAKEKLIITAAGKFEKRMKKAVITSQEEMTPFVIRSADSFAGWLTLCAMLHSCGYAIREAAGVKLVGSTEGEPPLTVRYLSILGDIHEPDEAAAVDQSIRPDKMLYLKLKKASDWVYPYDEITKIPQKIGVSALTKGESADHYAFSKVPGFLSGESMSGAQKGNAVHQFMQYADYAACAQDLDREVARMGEMAFLSPEQLKVLDREKLRRFFHSPLYRRMAASKRLERELRFIREVPVSQLGYDSQEESITVQGVADCVFYEDGKVVIVDYKTDIVSSADDLTKRYRGQLSLYREILSESLQTEVKECIIYSFHLGQEIFVK
ncbi:MAG: helicase-exonuclease AddAB subunit AddA [Oscillospiraceae bacterium]|nr:helicase-exonuclease AddAB subunit AddA [Oscillospiraceae bacterium]